MRIARAAHLLGAAVIAATVCAGSALAEDFYAGKTLKIVVGSAAGGGYDGAARLASRHMAGFLPGNPRIVVQNMPGASGVKATNYLYTIAEKDGTTIAVFNSAMPYYEALGQLGIQFKSRELSWIGAMTQVANVVVVWHTTGVKTLDEVKSREIIMGALTDGGTMGGYPLLLNYALGTKFKVVPGYHSGTEVNLAMERGEVQGRGSNPWTSWKSTHMDWIQQKKIVPLVQIGLKKDADLPDVPLLVDLAQNEDQRKLFEFVSAPTGMERPFAAPPGIPKERLAELRSAFDRMVKSEAFLEDARKTNTDIDPLSGPELEQVVARLMATPPNVLEQVRVATGEK
ncbi:MAG: Bug family tripartite tricarboxylate transporter substrate binding protein [Gemmatimonas sp.]